MKNLSIAVVVTALIAFSLGYYTRGALERAPNILKDTEQFTVLENSKVRAPQSIVRAEPNDESVQIAAGFGHEAISSTIDAARRESRARLKRERLEDFFLINGIGADRAEQIVQDLIEADYYLEQIQQTMLDRRTAEKAELIARGDEVVISLTPEERAAFEAESEAQYRRVFGEFYEAYEIYDQSSVQRLTVKSLASSLAEPLDYVAKETLVQIMQEEQSQLEARLESESAGSGAHPTSTLQGWEAEKEGYYKRIVELRYYNERVLTRTRPYLTASQVEQLERLLENEVRQFELLIELEDLDQ
jgi:hypothetical protein